MAYLVNAIPVVGLSLALALRWWCSDSIVLWGRRCVAISCGKLALALSTALQIMGPMLDQRVLDWTPQFGFEDWFGVQGPGYWLFPRLDHVLQVASCRLVDKSVGVHEGAEQIPAKVDGVRCAYVLHDTVEQVESWQLLGGCCLSQRSVRTSPFVMTQRGGSRIT